MSTEKVAEDIANCVRRNISWNDLPLQLKQVLHNNQRDYEKYVFNYSLKNQLRFRGNLASKVFRHEQRYYELLVQKSINGLCLFPYHLADIVTKGLRVTPFNYYLEVLSLLLRSDKSYDTLPNFTAADCLRVLGIGRNEYLTLISELKTHTSRAFFSAKPNPINFLPRFPVRIRIEPYWRIEVGFVLESDIRYTRSEERSLIDDLIDFGSQTAGKCDYEVVHSLYRKGLIYLDVPIYGEDRICIPPLRNFVMNRVSGDYFENLLYKIFVSADEHMTISELAQMLQVEFDSVKQAVSLFCRLGFAKLKNSPISAATTTLMHPSWKFYDQDQSVREEPLQITPLNFNSVMSTVYDASTSPTRNTVNNDTKNNQDKDKDSGSIGYLSDGTSDFSFAIMPSPSPQALLPKDHFFEEPELSSELDDISESNIKLILNTEMDAPTVAALRAAQIDKADKTGKRVGFLFDSTLTAFLMMGNLSPGLKNHAVTMFEVGKLCEESMDTFLAELEKVSLLDAEGEGDVSRYFAHAVILRSTICSLRHLVPGGLDLLRLECLESLDQKTRDRVLEKKYKFIISAAPLTANLSHTFSVPFLGQFYSSTGCSHMWTKLFYNHITGYGPPSLFLCRGTVLKTLPRIFLGYGKLLINILHSDSYIINSENFRNLNEQLKNGCVFMQGYGIRAPGEIRYEAFPFNTNDPRQLKWSQHKAILKLKETLDLDHHCGYISFLNTGVPDIGCETFESTVRLRRPKSKSTAVFEVEKKSPEKKNPENRTPEKNGIVTNVANISQSKTTESIILFKEDSEHIPDLISPIDGEVTSFARLIPSPIPGQHLKTPDENYFAVSPKCHSPANVFTSIESSELLAEEVANCAAAYEVKSNSGDMLNNAIVNASNEDLEIVNEFDDTTEEWTLLDVNFGVPLFDFDCNTRICERIVRKLCNNDNLEKLPATSASMNEAFIKFVSQCLFFEDEKVKLLHLESILPQPRINLAFENGCVSYWSGK